MCRQLWRTNFHTAPSSNEVVLREAVLFSEDDGDIVVAGHSINARVNGATTVGSASPTRGTFTPTPRRAAWSANDSGLCVVHFLDRTLDTCRA